jgi:hypothetical protein
LGGSEGRRYRRTDPRLKKRKNARSVSKSWPRLKGWRAAGLHWSESAASACASWDFLWSLCAYVNQPKQSITQFRPRDYLCVGRAARVLPGCTRCRASPFMLWTLVLHVGRETTLSASHFSCTFLIREEARAMRRCSGRQ